MNIFSIGLPGFNQGNKTTMSMMQSKIKNWEVRVYKEELEDF